MTHKIWIKWWETTFCRITGKTVLLYPKDAYAFTTLISVLLTCYMVIYISIMATIKKNIFVFYIFEMISRILESYMKLYNIGRNQSFKWFVWFTYFYSRTWFLWNLCKHCPEGNCNRLCYLLMLFDDDVRNLVHAAWKVNWRFVNVSNIQWTILLA